MISTDMIYYAVGTEDLDGGAQITASHNPKQYNGCKMVGRGNKPLSGESGISDIRDMIAGNRIPAAAAAPGAYTERGSSTATPSTCSASSIRRSSSHFA
jgi:phosphomannomutase